MTPDSLLGRDFLFRDGQTVRSLLTVVAWDPARGWKLTGRGYDGAWVADRMLRRLLWAGVLESA